MMSETKINLNHKNTDFAVSFKHSIIIKSIRDEQNDCVIIKCNYSFLKWFYEVSNYKYTLQYKGEK